MRRTRTLIAVGLLSLSACGSATPGSGTPRSTLGRPGAATVIAGCPSIPPGAKPAIVDYVDFVRVGGVEFVSGLGLQLVATAQEVGPEQFRVTCNFSELNRSSGREPPPAGEGAAGRLPVGTAVHAVLGWSPRCRLTAFHGGRWQVYQATEPGARTLTFAPCATDASSPSAGS